MPLEKLERMQVVGASLAEAWRFFSAPGNLAEITPPWLAFEVTSAGNGEIYAGMIITYRVRPLLGIPVTWVTEITHCRKPDYFVDEQRIGPYRFWHHQHHFFEVPEGVAIRDLVHYQLPFGPLGRAASGMVKRRLEAIFDFRTDAVQEQFRPRRQD